MSFSEESLEDKIAAIMNGKFNFTPPPIMRAPSYMPPPAVPRTAAGTITPLSVQSSTKSADNQSDEQSESTPTEEGGSKKATSKSPTAIIEDSPLLTSSSSSTKGATTSKPPSSVTADVPLVPKSEQVPTQSNTNTVSGGRISGNISRKSSAEALAEPSGNISRKASSESLREAKQSVTVETSNASSTAPSAVESQPSPAVVPGSLMRKGTALVGFGDVYDDVTDNVQYHEEDLHHDAVSDGYVGSVSNMNSVSFGDVYEATDEDMEFDKHGSSSKKEIESDAEAGEPEEDEQDAEPAPSVPAKASTVVEAVRQPSPKAVTPATVDLQDQLLASSKELKKQPSAVTLEDAQSRVQPQLEFVPLAVRKSPQDNTSPVEDKQLALDRERMSAPRVSPTEPPLLRASPPTSFVSAPTEKPATTMVAATPVAPAAAPVPVSSKSTPVNAPLPTAQEAEDKVHSLLFGEDDGEFDEDEADNESLNFSPDKHPGEDENPQIDDDSLNGDEAAEEHAEELAEPDDLAQTIRTTLPVSSAVRTSVELPSPASATSEKRRSAPETAEPAAEHQQVPPAVVPSTHTPTLGLPAKPRSTTPTSLARERAALLLPTIPEEKPPVPHKAAAHKPAAAHPAVPVPIKVPASTDSKDRTNFLARLSSATSVPIEVPPAPAVAHKSVVHKEKERKPVAEHAEHKEEKERSTTPTSIPKPTTPSLAATASAALQRPITPTSTKSTSSAASAHSAKDKDAHSEQAAKTVSSASSTPRTTPREAAPKAGNPAVAAVNRAASPPTVHKSTSEAPLSSKKKAVAVMMSTTSADEIAAASAPSVGGGSVKERASKLNARADSTKALPSPTAAVAGVKESTLLSSPAPQKEHAKSKLNTPTSTKKTKPEAWVIDSTPTAAPVEPAPAAPVPSATKKSSSKAAAWTIENGPAGASSSSAAPEPVPASPMLKAPTRSRTPEPAPRATTPAAASVNSSVSVNRSNVSITMPKNASLSAKLSQSPESEANSVEADKRSRAVSPNTTAKSVSRLAPHNANNAEDAPINERAVKVAVRVRPFTALEIQQGQRRDISMNDGRLVIVNPKSFDSQPDAVAKVAVDTENRQWANLFEFDNILWDYNPTTGVETLVDQIELHRALGLDIVENALSGVSSSCFAYGHTCTGKTYSLFGADMLGQDPTGKREPVSKIPTSLAKFSITEESGLIQRVFHDVIRLSHKNTRMFVTFMEIYNEKIRDLLSDNPAQVSSSLSDVHSNGSTTGRIHAPAHVVAAPDALKLREHPTFGPYVENLTKVEVFSVNDALRLIAKGQANRTSAQTVWNANSSRSHAVVTLELSPTEIDPNKQFVDPRAREVYENSHSANNSPAKLHPHGVSEDDLHSLEGRMEASNREHLRNYEAPLLQQVVRVQMVDLAGSEKDTMNPDEEAVWSGGRYNDTTLAKFPDSHAEKEKNELRLIRRSLSTLGFIIKALTKGASMRSLPYRDCTLTFLLRDALCGRNHTTMLATISPAHTCYEETLSTLRYAERLCEVHTNRKHAAATSGVGIMSLHGNMLGPRKAVLDEFMRIHQGLRAFKRPTSSQSRDLLRQTLSDPHQRARMSKIPALSNSGGPLSAYPMKGFTKPLSEVSEEDFEQLKNAYRQLSTDVVEMQIDLDAVRTDRDTLMGELRGATDMLNELESSKNEARSQVGSLTKYLRAAEKELADLHGLLKKRDENVDRLLGELTEEKQARSSAEQAYQARTKEFLARFEALKKENKVLAGSLDTVSDKHKSTADDKKDQAQQIERLKAQVKNLTQQKEAALAEVAKLKEEHAHVGKKYDAASVKVGRLEDLEKQLTGLILQNEKHKSEVAIVSSERDSVKAMLAQKDSALQAQTQQSERAVRMLQMKLTALERTLALSGVRSPGSDTYHTTAAVSTDAEYAKLQERVNALLSAEGQILQSELADTRKLTAVVKDMRLKLQEFEDLKFELQLERSAKEDLQKKMTEHSVNSQVSEVGKSALDHQVSLLQIELHQAHELNKKQAHEHQLQTEVFEGNKASLEEQVSTLQKELLTTKDALALTKARLLQQTNLAAKSSISSMDHMKLQAESAALKDQLILTQRDAFAAREELKSTQETMQAEYTKMWNSVQELSKLDALKDQSVQDLIMDRDKAILERDGALERFVAAKTESAQLLQELQDIDIELLHAVEAGEYRLSPRGQHKSIMLHNVSDRTMFGLARRQQQSQQALQATHLPITSKLAPAINSSFSFVGTPGASVSGMSISQQMGMSHTSHMYESPPPAPVSATSTPVLTFNHPSHVNPPPAGPQYTLPAPSSASSVGRAVSHPNQAPYNHQQSLNMSQGQGQGQGQQWSTSSQSAGQQQGQGHGQGQAPPLHSQPQRHPGGTPQSSQSFSQAPQGQQQVQYQGQQGQYQQGPQGLGQSWSSQQSLPAPANYSRPTTSQSQQQRPPQQASVSQPSPTSQQLQQQQLYAQQQLQGQLQQRASFQQQQQTSMGSAANREEKEYAMSEEALEKELEELSVMEDEVKNKRQRMKSGGSSGFGSSNNTSMSSINIPSSSASFVKKPAPQPQSKMNY